MPESVRKVAWMLEGPVPGAAKAVAKVAEKAAAKANALVEPVIFRRFAHPWTTTVNGCSRRILQAEKVLVILNALVEKGGSLRTLTKVMGRIAKGANKAVCLGVCGRISHAVQGFMRRNLIGPTGVSMTQRAALHVVQVCVPSAMVLHFVDSTRITAAPTRLQ